MAKLFRIRLNDSWLLELALGAGKQRLSQCIIVLIQWDTGPTWKRFQFSMGFSMLLGYLSSSDLFNRCLQLNLPFDFMNLDCNLEIVSFRFSPNLTNLPSGVSEYEEKFTAQWDTIFHQVMKDGNVNMRLIVSCGGWIEEDYKTEDRYFTGFLFWKSTGNGLNGLQRLSERNAHDIHNKITALSRKANSAVSMVTNPLKHLLPGTGKLQK